MASSTAFKVIPSEWYENGPISLLESFASGKPVIGSDVGGIPEHISHGIDGLIFENKNHIDLADKIQSLLSGKYSLISMGENSRKKIDNKYNKHDHIETIIGIYKQLIN